MFGHDMEKRFDKFIQNDWVHLTNDVSGLKAKVWILLTLATAAVTLAAMILIRLP